MQIFRQNLKLKFLALLIAVLGWMYFRFVGNPVIAARFEQQISVPITVIRVPVGFVAHVSEKQALVTIGARTPGSPALKPDEVKAVVDAANHVAGVYSIPVQVVAPRLPLRTLSPATVTLTIERLDERTFSVGVKYVGEQRLTTIVGGVALNPTRVVARGTTSSLAQVATVQVEVPLRMQPGAIDQMERAVAVNTLGGEVSGVQVSPSLIRVRATFLAPKKP